METTYEYLVRRLRELPDDMLELELNELGADGWNLAIDDGARSIFVRAKTVRRVYEAQEPQAIYVDSRRGAGRLSNRERDVAEKVAQGYSNRSIAAALQLQEQSIKNLVSAAMRKLNVENRTQLALRFYELTGA